MSGQESVGDNQQSLFSCIWRRIQCIREPMSDDKLQNAIEWTQRYKTLSAHALLTKNHALRAQFSEWFTTKSVKYYAAVSKQLLHDGNMAYGEYIERVAEFMQIEKSNEFIFAKIDNYESYKTQVCASLIEMDDHGRLINDAKRGLESIMWGLSLQNNEQSVQNMRLAYAMVPPAVHQLFIEFITNYIAVHCRIGQQDMLMFLAGFVRIIVKNSAIYERLPQDVMCLCLQFYAGQSSHLLMRLLGLVRGLNMVENDMCEQYEIRNAIRTPIIQSDEISNTIATDLASYCHERLVKGSVLALSSAEIDFKNVLCLYGILCSNCTNQQRDAIIAPYRQKLAHRLINDAVTNFTLETTLALIERPLTLSDNYDTHMKHMLQNYFESEELTINMNSKESFDIRWDLVLMLSELAWPDMNSSPKNILIPDKEMVANLRRLHDIYLRKYAPAEHREHRHDLFTATTTATTAFRIHHQHCSAKITIRFNHSQNKKKKMFLVSWFQMLILMLFNFQQVWTFGDILRETNIPIQDATNAILGMAHPKLRVLQKSPNTKQCDNSHKFQLNMKFNHPRQFIRVSTLKILQSAPEKKTENDSNAAFNHLENPFIRSSNIAQLNGISADNEKKVEVLSVRYVVGWRRAYVPEICLICRNRMSEWCVVCHNDQIGSHDECTIAWGECGHHFHFHCISRVLKTRGTCPVDGREWERGTCDFL